MPICCWSLSESKDQCWRIVIQDIRYLFSKIAEQALLIFNVQKELTLHASCKLATWRSTNARPLSNILMTQMIFAWHKCYLNPCMHLAYLFAEFLDLDILILFAHIVLKQFFNNSNIVLVFFLNQLQINWFNL